MDQTRPKRPWYRWKRTWAAVAVWLLVAYPASAGPASYGSARGWSPSFVYGLYGPLRSAGPLVGVHHLIARYCEWWVELGERHATPD